MTEPPPPMWDLLPPDILVVLKGEPIKGGAVYAAFRPGLHLAAMERAGIWARERYNSYARSIESGGDCDDAGRVWHWDGFHAVHVLLGRRQEIYGP